MFYSRESQTDPVQPLLHIQVSGNTHVPCAHGDVQMAVNYCTKINNDYDKLECLHYLYYS